MLLFERAHARADAQTQLGHASRPRETREPGRNTGGAKLRQPERQLRGGGSSAGLRAFLRGVTVGDSEIG